MRAFARRWLTGDERTVGLVLAVGLLTMAYFRLDKLRHDLGVAAPSQALALLLVAVALTWWSMLPRGFVWLEPSVLTWEDFGAIDRAGLVSRRLIRGWLARQLALVYLLALLMAIIAAPLEWVAAGAGVVVAAGLLALAAVRNPPDYGTTATAPHRPWIPDVVPGKAGTAEIAQNETEIAEAGRREAGITRAVSRRTGISATVSEAGTGGPGIPDVGPDDSGTAEVVPGETGIVGTASRERGTTGFALGAAGTAGAGPGGPRNPSVAPSKAVITDAGSGEAGTVEGVPREVGTALFRQAAVVEVGIVVLLAVGAVAFRPGPIALAVLAGVLAIAAVPLLARSGPAKRPRVATTPTRTRLVDGWRERILRTTGVHFLDLGLLLPAARPVNPNQRASIAWLGVRARARYATTAGLLALTAVATHLAFPNLNHQVLFATASYLALVPLSGGLGDLWRSPGRRRWVTRSDTALRIEHFAVFTAVAAAWAGLALALAQLAGHAWTPTVLLTIPLTAAAAVRTAARPLPTYDNLGQVDTPIGAMPLRLIFQTVRGPDVCVLALIVMPAAPVLVGVAVVTLAVLVCVLR